MAFGRDAARARALPREYEGRRWWRVRRWWRRLDERLSLCQDPLLALTLLVAIGLGVLFLFQTLRLLVSATGTGLVGTARAVAWDGEIRETEFPETQYRAATPEKEPAAKAEPVSPRPRIDWADREVRRRAASLLALAGDYLGALDLLPAEDPDREELRRVSSSRHQAVLEALDEIHALAGDSSPDHRAVLLRLQGESSLQRPLHRSVASLHRDLRERTGASDAHLRLVLEACFPPRSPARRLYLESKALYPTSTGPPQEPRRGERK